LPDPDRLVTMVTSKSPRVEARWPALLALIAVGVLNLALPSTLTVGPRWVLLALVVTLLVPTVIAHRAGYASLNRALL
jgi:hypothetical protein